MKHAPKHYRRGDAGLSLLEVLVAGAIFAIGIVGVMRLFPEALRQIQTANQRSISATLAESEFGRVRVEGAESLSQRSAVLPGSVINAIYATDEIYQGYTTTSIGMPGSANTHLQRVTFTVQMADGREERYVTYVSKQ